MRKAGAVIVALILGVLAPRPDAAAAEVKFVTVDAAPWAWASGSGAVDGAFPIIVGELSRRAGVAVTITTMPFARIDRELETGGQDCTIILWNEGRGRIVQKGEDIYTMTFGVVARKDVRLGSYEELKPLTISVVRNLAIEARFDQDASLRKDFDKDYSQGLHKIAHRRLDAVAGAIPTIIHQARRDGLVDHLGDRLVLTRIPLALQCARQSRHLGKLEAFNAAIRQMRDDGTLVSILAEYDYY